MYLLILKVYLNVNILIVRIVLNIVMNGFFIWIIDISNLVII